MSSTRATPTRPNDVRLGIGVASTGQAYNAFRRGVESGSLESVRHRRQGAATADHFAVVIDPDPRGAAADLLPGRLVPDPASADHCGEDQRNRNGYHDAATHRVEYDPPVMCRGRKT
jgi:hypothetical protein